MPFFFTHLYKKVLYSLYKEILTKLSTPIHCFEHMPIYVFPCFFYTFLQFNNPLDVFSNCYYLFLSLVRCWHLTHVQRRVWRMQLTFSCSYLEEMVPPETLCSDCCSVEPDTWDTLFANRSVSTRQLHECLFSSSYLSKCSFSLYTFLKLFFFFCLRHVTGRT